MATPTRPQSPPVFTNNAKLADEGDHILYYSDKSNTHGYCVRAAAFVVRNIFLISVFLLGLVALVVLFREKAWIVLGLPRCYLYHDQQHGEMWMKCPTSIQQNHPFGPRHY